MFRIRNLLGVGIAVVMLILMTSWASAQPAQQGDGHPCANHGSRHAGVTATTRADADGDRGSACRLATRHATSAHPARCPQRAAAMMAPRH